MDNLALFQLSIFEIIVNMLLYAAWLLMAGAIAVNFIRARDAGEAEKRKVSIADTFTMSLFFALFLVLCIKALGRLPDAASVPSWIYPVAGLVMIYGGIALNVLGRLALKNNWGNQILIYRDHSLVTGGIYGFIRHPLYSSTILVFYGMGVVFSNWLVILLNLLLFTPFMNLRAAQEEKLLKEKFSEYTDYCSLTGRFFPRLRAKGRESDDCH